MAGDRESVQRLTVHGIGATPVWDVASPERRKQLFWMLFESAKVGEKRILSVRPRPEIAPLLALNTVQSCGPDRGRDRSSALRLFGLPIDGIESLAQRLSASPEL